MVKKMKIKLQRLLFLGRGPQFVAASMLLPFLCREDVADLPQEAGNRDGGDCGSNPLAPSPRPRIQPEAI